MAPRSFQKIDWNKSYGARWVPLIYRDTASHVVSTYRSELNSLSEFQFVWRPYDNILHQVPDMCRNGQNCWRSQTFLICWHIVEPHQPGRFLRQFGMFQPIPMNTLLSVDDHKNLHKIKRVGGRASNWIEKHEPYILSWINRHNHVVNEINSSSPVASQDYMTWYRSRTVLYTSNPTHIDHNPRVFPNDRGRAQMLMDSMSQVYQRSTKDSVRDLAGRYMEYANARHHMSYQPTYESESVGSQGPPMTQRVRRRGRGANVGQANPTDQMVYRTTMPSPTTHVGQSSQFIIPNVDLFGSPFGFDNMQMGGSSSQFDLTPQLDFSSPAFQMPFYNNLDGLSAPDFHQGSYQRPTRNINSQQINFDLNLEFEDQDEGEELAEESEDDEGGSQDVGGSSSIPIARRKQPRKNAGIGRGCDTH
ncbi:hypothetical protein E3N88_43029 [Mikania micrantha]|uniref:Aminotransferase-like plant mobile domain-containing protein n=1 Tax=Mikania micrantha TaxID=192012 RepID=A0A5N6LG20_9ASTR|nr:hypothetical protein E3N88_43029 [Mikania micrantha]